MKTEEELKEAIALFNLKTLELIGKDDKYTTIFSSLARALQWVIGVENYDTEQITIWVKGSADIVKERTAINDYKTAVEELYRT